MKVPNLIFLVVICSIVPSWGIQHLLNKVERLHKITTNLIQVKVTIDTTDSMVTQLTKKRSKIGKVIHSVMKRLEILQNEKDIEATFGFIKALLMKLRSQHNMSKWARDMKQDIRNIDAIFQEFSILYNVSASTKSWEAFAKRNIQLGANMQGIKSHLKFSGLRSFIQEDNETHSNNCAETRHVPHFLGHFLQKLLYTEIKALATSIYVSLVQYAEDGQWHKVLSDILKDSKKRVLFYVNEFTTLMDIAPRTMTACDPRRGIRIRDHTFFEIERLEQTVIFQYNSALRSKDCENAVNKELLEYDSPLDNCTGSLSNCTYSGSLEVCRLEDSVKRYEWIKSEAGDSEVNIDECLHGNQTDYSGITNVLTSHCVCKCQEPTDNRISLDLVMTDVKNNMVITGLRFVRINSVLHLEVKQGGLLPDGWINEDSEEWLPIPENPKNTASINVTNNTFHLGDVILPEDFLAVGVKFHYNNGFAITVIGQKFNSSIGELSAVTVERILNTSHHVEMELPLRNSIYTDLIHTPDSSKQSVKLVMSDFGHDAGQSVLPLFDGVAIEAHAPVAGLGIVHKGAENYAGFISPRLIAPQYTQDLLQYKKKTQVAKRT